MGLAGDSSLPHTGQVTGPPCLVWPVSPYHGLMVRRIVAAVLILLGALLASMGIGIAISMARLFSDSGAGWLGSEPEMLIPMASLLVGCPFLVAGCAALEARGPWLRRRSCSLFCGQHL